METKATGSAGNSVCGACGVESSSLKKCTACRSISYCNRDCQRAHRKEHRKECKRIERELQQDKKRDTGSTAQSTVRPDPLKDFVAPPRPECPICMVPFPLPLEDSISAQASPGAYMACCGKTICEGCNLLQSVAFEESEMKRKHNALVNNQVFQPKVPVCEFCRAPRVGLENTKELFARTLQRAEKNDADALRFLGKQYLQGIGGLPKNEKKALEFIRKACELGDASAANALATCYANGHGVPYDRTKALKYNKIAAEGGHVSSRYNLARMTWNDGDQAASMLHFRIAAAAGHKESLDYVQKFGYALGMVTKDELATTLRAYQAAIDETKSDAREAAEKYREYTKAGRMDKVLELLEELKAKRK